jgi:hypothetical protein
MNRHRRKPRNRLPPWRSQESSSPPRPVLYYAPLTEAIPQEQATALQAKCDTFLDAPDGVVTPLTPNEKHIVIDTGASITITNTKSDFIHQVQPAWLQGIASGLEIKGMGSVLYLHDRCRGVG